MTTLSQIMSKLLARPALGESIIRTDISFVQKFVIQFWIG